MGPMSAAIRNLATLLSEGWGTGEAALRIRAFCAFIARNQSENALPSYILLLSFGKFLI